MAVEYGTPGEWAKIKGTAFSLWPLFLCFSCMGAFLSAALLGRCVAIFAGLLAASLVLTAILWRKGLRRVRSFFKGACGEEMVAAILRTLPREYYVFHDFLARGTPVDHVVVGAAGVFSIETKNWGGKVTDEEGHLLVDGRLPSRSPTVQSAREAAGVKGALKRAGWDGVVTPVVCFASNTCVKPVSSVSGVMVVNANALTEWMMSLPAAMQDKEVARLVQLMETNT